MDDEGPSPEDIERFDRDTAFCPECGAEIWDQAEVCAECKAYIGGQTLSRTPIEQAFRQKWIILIALAVLAGLLIWLL